jgi:small neutral amino acid transporter SnatA (MarC family)
VAFPVALQVVVSLVAFLVLLAASQVARLVMAEGKAVVDEFLALLVVCLQMFLVLCMAQWRNRRTGG